MRTPLAIAKTMPTILRPALDEVLVVLVEVSARASIVADMEHDSWGCGLML